MSCWLASLLRCPESTASDRVPSPTAVSSFSQPTLFSRPVTTSGPAEISSPKPFVWFRAKTDKGIVCLAGHLHSVTTLLYIRPISKMLWVFADDPGDRSSIPGRVIPKTQKWYLIPPCIVRYRSRVKWSNLGKGVGLSPTPRCTSYWKEAFESLSTMVANFNIYI